MYNRTCEIVLQQKCQLAISKWRRVKNASDGLTLFNKTLQNKKLTVAKTGDRTASQQTISN